MFKALKEIGIVGALKFAIMEPLSKASRVIYIPQLRRYYLMLLGARIGADSIVMGATFVNAHKKGFSGLHIGNRCYIGEQSLLDLTEEIEMGDDSTLAERVIVLTHLNIGYKDHPLIREFPSFARKTTIGSGSFVGSGAVIFGGITIGKNCAIGANAVVTKDVPDNSVALGVPAKVVRKTLAR